MDIQHSSHRKLFKAKHRDTPFYHLFEADDDLVTELTSFINSLFAPLTWILEETLYRRVHKQDKGWIKIDFLHRNKRFQSIFQKFEIPSHCRRRKNFLKKAIQRSIIKRKRNLIKRRDYLKISQEVKKVVYIEFKALQSGKQNNQIDKVRRNFMTQRMLRKMIGESISQIIHLRRQQQNPNRMEIQGQESDKKGQSKIMSEIVFQGSLLQNQEKNSHIDANQNKESIQNEIAYRWCFIYFPLLEEHQVQKVLSDIEKFISSNKAPQKIQLEREMDNLHLTDKNLNESQESKRQKSINILTLSQMIEQYYPKYNQVCQEIGQTHVDYRKQALKVRQKQRQKQKVRLLQSRYLDNKIDLVNKYHVKLEIEKQKRAYWEKRNKQIQEKIRKRQERRRNRINRSEEYGKKKDLTEKLKELFDIDQPKKQSKNQQSYEEKPQSLNFKNMKTEFIGENQLNDQIEPSLEIKGPKIKIKIPKFEHQDSPKSLAQNLQGEEKYIDHEEKKVQNVNLDELYEDQINYEYDSMMSSGEEFELPKKKKRNKNLQSSKKNKKIVKQTDHRASKNSNGKHSASKSSKIHSNSQQSSNRQSSRNLQKSNGTYNLRHKSPSQGSYLKMAGYEYEEESSKKKQNRIYEEDDDEEKQEQSNGKNVRLRKRNEYYDW